MSDDALNDFCDWLEAEAAHTINCPFDCPLCSASAKIKELQAAVKAEKHLVASLELALYGRVEEEYVAYFNSATWPTDFEPTDD
jgi:hypothetical protein